MTTLEEMFGKFDDFEYRERRPLNKIVENIGINDSPFIVEPTNMGKRVAHPAYRTWKNMLVRCYSSKYKEREPTYSNITCCEEWLLFTNFAKWFKDNYIKGHQLDKDMLVKNNTTYSPDTCLFISQELNLFIALRDKCMGSLPLGVSKSGSKYVSKINSNNYLGTFSDPLSAHREWQKAKLEQAIAFNFPPLQRVIDQLTFEIENNLETTSL